MSSTAAKSALTDRRPIVLDDEPEESWDTMTPDRKLEYLLRQHRETVQHSIDSTKRIEDALTGVLTEVQSNTSNLNELSAIVGNQSKVLAEQFKKVHDRIDGLVKFDGMDAESFGAVAAELAAIRTRIEEEKKAREKQDSIHEEEITGVEHKVAQAEKKADAAHEKAETLFTKVTSQLTATNVAKGTFLGVVTVAIEALVKNLDVILKFFH
jgi:DNA repair ATPase RecN